MTDAPAASPIDTSLLARMTGRSGDRRTLEAVCVPMAERIAPLFEAAASEATGFSVNASYAAFDIGTWSEMADGLDEHAAVRVAAIDDWCDFFC